MKPEIKTAWLAALRSGQYKQGQRRLHEGDRFCCLGVLCDLHSKATGQEWKQSGTVRMEYMGHVSLPPPEVLHWASLEFAAMVQAPREISRSSLDGLNDAGYSFQEIADLIEAQL